MGVGIVEEDLRHDARLPRVGNVEDRSAEVLFVADMADVGVFPDHGDLAGAWQLEA
jgi:hypothetical protein